LPVIFTGPPGSADYFAELDGFLKIALGEAATERYQVIVGQPETVAASLNDAIRLVRKQRRRDGDAYYFNWLMKIPFAHQVPFDVTHESVADLDLDPGLPRHEIAVNLRRAFSAIVTGNVKDYGIRMIERDGPFELRCGQEVKRALDKLLDRMVKKGRMKLATEAYKPCYRVV
jgi:hypothetical protein